MTALRRAEDEYADAIQGDQHPEFTHLFDHVALNTAAVRVHSRLGLTDAKHRNEAIGRLNQALADNYGGQDWQGPGVRYGGQRRRKKVRSPRCGREMSSSDAAESGI